MRLLRSYIQTVRQIEAYRKCPVYTWTVFLQVRLEVSGLKLGIGFLSEMLLRRAGCSLGRNPKTLCACPAKVGQAQQVTFPLTDSSQHTDRYRRFMVSGIVGTWRDPLFRRPQRGRCRWLSLLVKFIENSHPSLFLVELCQGHAFPCSQQRCGYRSSSCRCTGGRKREAQKGSYPER